MAKRRSNEQGERLRAGVVQTPEEARERLETKVAALQRPSAYPGGVERVEAIETHMSWVFLTGRHAYKLKKPIRTRFLDYRSLEARRDGCRRELALNRRLAADVYKAVVPLVDADGRMQVEAGGEPVEWLVKMRRLPEDRMLDRRIDRHDVRPPAIEGLAEKLVDFYRDASAAPESPEAYRHRLTSDIESKRASLQRGRYGLKRGDIRAVTEAQRRWLQEHGALLESRAEHVVDAHGDLRPEHVCLEAQPVVIDCLEFDRSLRLLEPVSELAFLSMECGRLGAAWIRDHLFEVYAQRTGDRVPARLVAFYQSYHALVRATVAVWHIDDESVDTTERWRREGSRYLRTARRLLDGA